MTAVLEVFAAGTDTAFAVHHFGVATEHLLKGYLSSFHPALLIDATDFPGLLHATGHRPHASTALPDAKTITAMEAFKRCNQLLKPKLPITEPVFKDFLNTRNGVSHMGAHAPDKARATLITSISIVDPLLAALGVQLADYWGDYMGLHAELLEKRANDLKISYQMKVAAARKTLDNRRGDVDARVFAMMASELDPYDGDDSEPATCPAFGATGRL
ncbi:hypothetical protein [Streptomyces sp. NPDC005096]|uniref:hypothetical protein n=1 Tax=Streptomyces sp. NPDC005096 TaxID=3154559 RepID=UPI0033B82EF8